MKMNFKLYITIEIKIELKIATSHLNRVKSREFRVSCIHAAEVT